MLVTIAIVYFSWSLIWIVCFLFEESHYFDLEYHLQYSIDLGVSIYHTLSLLLVIVFYFQSYQFRQHFKLSHYEQKFWLFVGALAALANILKNVYSESMGLGNMLFFWPATLQNTLVYFASIYCILILDGWNMEEEPKYIKNSVWIMIIAQTIINLTLLVEGFNSYLHPPKDVSLLQLLFLTIYRTWLIYFGWKKTAFLYRKTCRWGCEVFIYSVCYARLPDKTTKSITFQEPTVLRNVAQRYQHMESLLSPTTEIDFNDPQYQEDTLWPANPSFYFVKY